MSIQSLTVTLSYIKEQNNFYNFSMFLASRMGIDLTAEDANEIPQRRQAYREFRKRTEQEEIASLPTMKRWFGIGGLSTPNREQIYHMCFAMHLSAEETREYLYYGLHEPSFQVNDYHEIILAYGLCHGYSFQECLNKITEFENRINPGLKLIQTQGTQMLLDEFQEHRNQKWDLFMEWMLERAAFFKGYSKTTLNYFEKYKKIILSYIKQDARQELDMLLTNTDYEHWCRLHPFLPAEPEIKMQKYITSCTRKGNLPKDLQKALKELLKLAFSSHDSNTLLLNEVFNRNHKKTAENKTDFPNLVSMTRKHLSDLLNIPLQKERYLMVQRGLNTLNRLDPSLSCPEWIQQMAKEYPRNAQILQTVGEAKLWLENYLSENKRRCLQIGRSDLMPLILYVAQRRYLESIGHDMDCYNQTAALKQFEELANSTLAACNMMPLSEKYELDVLLRLCYQKDELYSYSELLETVHQLSFSQEG